MHQWGDKPGIADRRPSPVAQQQSSRNNRSQSMERVNNHRDRGRKPFRNNSRSPTSGKRRMYLKSPGGTYRSISRGRIKYADSKLGGLRNRPPSAGSRPASAERRGCLVCGETSHDHKDNYCKVYGRSRPTTRFCNVCFRNRNVKAHHADEACVYPVIRLSQSKERPVHYIEVDQPPEQGHWDNLKD